jgi:nicotinamidase-related amidase
MIALNPKTTALVLIDLQNGIVGMDLAPRTGAQTLAAGEVLARRFREAGALVVLVNVAFAADYADMVRRPTDQPMAVPPGGLPAAWSELAEGLAQPGDIRVTKRQWGAFHGTSLDLELRRRGIDTIVLGGIVTNFGVESTARAGFEHGYAMVLVEDAMTGVSAEAHAFAVERIFPRLGRVVTAKDLAFG